MDRRSIARVLLGCALLMAANGCRLPEVARSELPSPEPALWRAPEAAREPERLRIEPSRGVAGLGESVRLRVEGELAGSARCVTEAGETGAPPEIELLGPDAPGVIEVICGAGGVRAAAQVTFSAARVFPLADPYAGGVALFKLRRPPVPPGPEGMRALGHASLDATLAEFSAWALPAFPFADPGARDHAGIGLWIAIDVPAGVNYYQAIERIRSDPAIVAPSFLPVDSEWLGVEQRSDWPVAFAPPSPGNTPPAIAEPAAIRPQPDPIFATRDLRAVGAPQAWSVGNGEGVRIAIVDTGLDVNHAALAPNLIWKPEERPGSDADGNGVPGDASGANFAHLALARGSGPPRLALGLVSDVSDWHGALEDAEDWGHGTAIASLAAGAGGSGARLGVAPRAELLAVDVEENLRLAPSTLWQEDPRMRIREAGGPPLRSSTWARAAGIVYAVGARARVLTCAWSEDVPHLLLHDALRYAEDNCALPVCAVDEPPGPLESFPAQWRSSWLASVEGGSGSALDLWSGAVHEDYFPRPLGATLIAGALEANGDPTPEADEIAPDLFAPTGGWRGRGGVPAATSNPRDDQMPTPDFRSAPFRGPSAAAGLIAGSAALVTGLRPDLEPAAVADALRRGARDIAGNPALFVPDALRAAQSAEPGSCERVLQRRAPSTPPHVRVMADAPEAPWWQRLGWGRSTPAEPTRSDAAPPPPASPEPAP